MLSRGDTVVVAVSGGVDSCVLLDLLIRIGDRRALTLVVAHLNHGLRGAESDGDEAFVAALARSRGLRFVSRRVEGLKARMRKGETLQVAARRVRYAFLSQIRQAEGARVVALGHTRTDQAETVLHRLVRGTGVDGLTGMAARRNGWIVRPLLCAGRADVEAYAQSRALAWVEDSSNASDAYTRNRIRHRIWPLLIEENPRIEQALSGLAESARRDTDLLDKLVGTVWNSGAVVVQLEQVTFDRSRLLEAHPALQFRLLRRAIRKVQAATGGAETVGRDHLARAVALVESGAGTASMDLPGGVRLVVGPGKVAIVAGAGRAREEIESVELAVPGTTQLPDGSRILVEVLPRAAFAPKARTHDVCWLDAGVLGGPLHVRRAREGDRFHPFGSPGPMRLSRFFIREKVPRLERPDVPLVVNGERIVWVVGLRGSEFAKVLPSTQRILKLTWVRPESRGVVPETR